MTIVVLDDRPHLLHRYADWLADSGRPLVAFTRADRAARPPHPGYTRIHPVDGYTRSAAVELAVLRLADTTPVTGIVATGFTDLRRAAALREYLGIRGQRPAGALAAVDLAVQRDLLARAGIAVVPGFAVDHPAELCRHAAALGYPVRLRRRRTHGWPGVARFTRRIDLIDYLGEHAGGWRTLLVEPDRPGDPGAIGWPGPVAGPSVGDGDIGAAVAAALPDVTGPLRIGIVRRPDGTPLVDGVTVAAPENAGLRQVVCDQAGLAGPAVAS